jgi:hypothetical protein
MQRENVRSWRRAAASAGFYALLGPLVGSLLIALPLYVFLLVEQPTAESVGMLIGLPVVVFCGYILGVVPAALTGFVAGWSRHRVSCPAHVLWVGVLGAVITGLTLGAFFHRGGDGDAAVSAGAALREAKAMALMVVPGFGASLFCAWRQLRDNRASLPTQEAFG